MSAYSAPWTHIKSNVQNTRPVKVTLAWCLWEVNLSADSNNHLILRCSESC